MGAHAEYSSTAPRSIRKKFALQCAGGSPAQSSPRGIRRLADHRPGPRVTRAAKPAQSQAVSTRIVARASSGEDTRASKSVPRGLTSNS